MKRAWIALGVLFAVLGCSLWAVGAVRSHTAANAKRPAKSLPARGAAEQQSAIEPAGTIELAYRGTKAIVTDEGRTRLVAAEVPFDEADDYYGADYGQYDDSSYDQAPAGPVGEIEGPRPWWRRAEFGNGEYSPYDDRNLQPESDEQPLTESPDWSDETPREEISGEEPSFTPRVNEFQAESAPIEEAPLEIAPVEVAPVEEQATEDYFRDEPTVQEAPAVEVPAAPMAESSSDASTEPNFEFAANPMFDDEPYFTSIGEVTRLEAMPYARDDYAGWQAPGIDPEAAPQLAETHDLYAEEYYALPIDEAAVELNLPRIGTSDEIDYESILAAEYAAESLKNVSAKLDSGDEYADEAAEGDLGASNEAFDETINPKRADAGDDWDDEVELPPVLPSSESTDADDASEDSEDTDEGDAEETDNDLGSATEPGIQIERIASAFGGERCLKGDREIEEPAPAPVYEAPAYEDYAGEVPAYEADEEPAAESLPEGEGWEQYDTYDRPEYYDEGDESSPPATESTPAVPNDEAAEVRDENYGEYDYNYDFDYNYDAESIGEPMESEELEMLPESVPAIDASAATDALFGPCLKSYVPEVATVLEECPLVCSGTALLSPCEEEWYKLQLREFADDLRTESGVVELLALVAIGREELVKFDWTVSLRLVRNVGVNRFSHAESSLPEGLWDGLEPSPAVEATVPSAPTAKEFAEFRVWLVTNVRARVQHIETVLHDITGQLLQPANGQGDENVWSAGRAPADQR